MPRDTSKSLHKLCVIREKLEYRHFVSCILNFCSPSKSHTPCHPASFALCTPPTHIPLYLHPCILHILHTIHTLHATACTLRHAHPAPCTPHSQHPLYPTSCMHLHVERWLVIPLTPFQILKSTQSLYCKLGRFIAKSAKGSPHNVPKSSAPL